MIYIIERSTLEQMQQIDIQEKKIDRALFQFVFPFSLKQGTESSIYLFLNKSGFKLFQLNQLEDECAYYGDFKVSHRDMEAYYLSFTNKILFPHSEKEKGLHRYSKPLNIRGKLITDTECIPFQIHSVDLTTCPYELGFLTIRTELKPFTSMSLSHSLEFADRFRVLEPRTRKDSSTKIECDGKIYKGAGEFVFNNLFEGLSRFFEGDSKENSYFETFSFFEDERMYVQSLVALEKNEKIDVVDVYRMGSLCGLTVEGKPYVHANNLPYIQDYLQKHAYQRWAPSTYFLIEEHIFTCITIQDERTTPDLANQFYGEFYYGLVLNLFHKIVLLKLANTYTELNIEKDVKEMEKLIYSINSFTANYFSLEIVSQSRSRDIFYLLRKNFNIELLYKEAKQSLESLFRYQENVNAKKDSLLLLILTLYSVVGQMLGMGLVVNDFIGKITWRNILAYNPVEYFALILAASGVIISLILGIQSLYQWIIDQRNRKKWVKQTVLSSTKE